MVVSGIGGRGGLLPDSVEKKCTEDVSLSDPGISQSLCDHRIWTDGGFHMIWLHMFTM